MGIELPSTRRADSTFTMIRVLKPNSPTLWMVWHGIAAATLILIPSQLGLGDSIWALSLGRLQVLIGFALAYLAIALLVAFRLRNSDFISLRDLALIGLAVLSAYFFWLLMAKPDYSRPMLVAALAAAGLSFALSFGVKQSYQKLVLSIVTTVLVVMQALGERPGELLTKATKQTPKPRVSTRAIETALHSLRVTFFDNYIGICPGGKGPCSKPGEGGGLVSFYEGYLVAAGEGSLHFLELGTNNGTLGAKTLPYRIPINPEAFASSGAEVKFGVFRVTDILVREIGERFRLFAAHHYWNAEKACVVLRVSVADGDHGGFVSGTASLEWRTIFESVPCLRLQREPRSGGLLSGESGGRLILLDDRRLLLTIGDHDYNGWQREKIFAQDLNASYGKTVVVDAESGAVEVFSSGHRNPQGLYLDKDGTIWLTEHGPEGGDELNVILKGANYGWPLATYGTASGRHNWPPSKTPGDHTGFRLPLYAWLPDIAVADVIRVEGDGFPMWKHDLLVASFKKALWRIRVREGRVVYTERIEIRGENARIRDIAEGRDGRLVLWIDGGSIAVLEPMPEKEGLAETIRAGKEMRGQLAFARCSGCHSAKGEGAHGIGPDLLGVVGRRVAGASGFQYSNALAGHSGTWDTKALDEFLANSQRFAPGTSMQFEGIIDASERASLIEYLKTLK